MRIGCFLKIEYPGSLQDFVAMKMSTYFTGILLLVLFLNSACAPSSNEITVDPGKTPFISFARVQLIDFRNVTEIGYRISPKPGSASEAVNVTYPIRYLRDRGYVNNRLETALVPVFGLYAGFENQVSFRVKYASHEEEIIPLTIQTQSYVGPKSELFRPEIKIKRAANAALGFSFFAMKSLFGPVVVDTDGEIRWVTEDAGGFSSIFIENGFSIGNEYKSVVTRLELDGTVTETSVDFPNFDYLHHNLDPGKNGILAELGESQIVEFDPKSGQVIHVWDLSQIVGDYMRSQGDDPSLFIRDGSDWIHVNASTFDPSDDSIIVSSRENFLIKLDYSTGEIIWIMGDETKYWHTFPSLAAKALTLNPGGLAPIGQHSTSITSGGHLMVFNDGFVSRNQPAGKPVGVQREVSYLSTYQVNAANMSVENVWNFSYDGIYSRRCSSVYEGPENSLLVDFSTADNETHARLIGLDSNRNVVFDFQYDTDECKTAWNAVIVPFENMVF